MTNPRKNEQKLMLTVLVVAIFSIGFTGFGCARGGAETSASLTGGADAAMAAKSVAEADSLWEGREDLQKARVAVAALRQARTADYGSYEAAWKLARAAFYVGDHTGNAEECDDMFREGIEAGKAAVQLQPNKPDGHFWLGANYGGSAAHSTISNLSSFNDIKNEMDAVLKIDASYQDYSVYLGLGRLYLQAPHMLGGDSAKAIEYLEKGVKLNPNHMLMRYHLAEAYAQNNRDAEAKKQLETLLATPVDPKYTAEHNEAVAKAKNLLQKIELNAR